ncbi:MAG: Ig-like domain-containing protein [Planctomycetota bacterium]
MSIRKLFSRAAHRPQRNDAEPRRRLLRKRLLMQESLEERRLLAVMAINDFFDVSEDSNAVIFDVLANDEDAAGVAGSASLDIVSVGPATGGTAVNDISGASERILFTPFPEFNGSATIVYRIDDTADGQSTTSTTTVTVTVTEVNDPPVAVGEDLGAIALEDGQSIFDTSLLTSNDSPGPANETGQTLSIANLATTSVAGGTLSLSNGGVVYTPAPNFNGTDTFTYQVQDNGSTNGAADPQTSNTVTATLTVTPVNDAPIPGFFDGNGSSTTPFIINVSGLFPSSQTGPVHAAGSADDESGQTLSFAGVASSSVQGGSVRLDNNGTPANPDDDVIEYIAPSPAFSGADSFTYTLMDSGGTANGGIDSATGTINLNITAPPPPPGTSARVDPNGNLVIDDPAGNDNQFRIEVDANDPTLLRISDPNSPLAAGPGATQDGDDVLIPIASITGELVVNGGDGDDELELDFSNGNPIPAGGVQFNGGGQSGPAGDILSVIGTFSNQIFDFQPPGPDGNNGSITVDGSVVTFTGLEPINAGNSVNTILNLPAGLANNAVLRNSAVAGEIEIIDNGATFEDTVIPNPTGSLTVNLGGQGDTLNVEALDPSFDASLVIAGGTGSDTVNLNGATTIDLASGDLVVDSFVEATNLTGSVASDGQTYAGPVFLADDTTLNSSGTNGNVILLSNVDGAHSLTVNASGTTTFLGAVGVVTPLTSLSTDAAGATAINGGAITTTGVQTYNDNVTVGADISFTGTTVGFNENLNSDAGNNRAVTVTGDAVVGDGPGDYIGNADALQSFVVTGTTTFNSIRVAADTVTTVGLQVYTGPVTLAGDDTRMTSTGGADVSFLSTVDGADTLAINTSTGTALFSDSVGGTTPLTSIESDAGGSTQFDGASVTTTGSQTYNDTVVFGVDLTMTGDGIDLAGNVTSQIASQLTIDGGATNSTIGGEILGDFDLVKEGSGELTLGRESLNFTGDVNVDDGTLNLGTYQFGNPLSSVPVFSLDSGTLDATGLNNGEFSVGAGQVLEGDGNVIGNVIGNVSPGFGPGQFGVLSVNGPVSFNAGNTLEIQIDGSSPGTDQSQLISNAFVDIFPGSNLTLSGTAANLGPGDEVVLIDSQGGVNGPFDAFPEGAVIPNFLGSGQAAIVTYTGGDGNDMALLIGGGIIAVDPMGNLVIEDSAGTQDDDLTIIVDGPNYRISDPTNPLVAGVGATQDGPDVLVPIASVTGEIRVRTEGGNDDLTLDFTDGDLMNPVRFDGGGQTGAPGDSLSIIGNFTNQVFNYAPPGPDGNNGDVFLDDLQVTYTGLEPINGGNAVNTTLNLPAGIANNATLQNSVNPGEIEIIDNGATFEDTVIPNPTGTLTVNLGDQGDVLVVLALDGAFGASLNLNGGAGDDVIEASPVPDLAVPVTITGGVGNDTLAGTNGNDVIRGGDGDDLIFPRAGMDQLLGDADNDTFFVFTNDGSALVEGGTGDSDELVIQGFATDDSVQLFGGGLYGDDQGGLFPPGTLNNSARAIVEIGAGAAFVNSSDVEDFQFFSVDGADTFVAGNTTDAVSGAGNPITIGTDLSATSIAVVEAGLVGGGDNVEVHGSAGEDDLDVAVQGPTVFVEGLPFAFEIFGADTTDNLFVHGQAGDDTIKAEAGVENSIGIILAGDGGDDLLSADALLLGGPGNDTLVGGAGDDTALGEAGDDTYVLRASNQGGIDSFVGGAGFNTILVEGTPGPDVITIDEAGGVHTISINGGGPTMIDAASAFERLLVDTGDGDDVVTTSGEVVGLEVQFGAGDDVLDASLQTTPVIAFGGAGNDNLIGSDPADGASLSDQLFGGDGDDRIEGGRGQDLFDGGAGNDYFVWVAGDGSDLMEGGGGESDELVFVANTGDNRLEVFGGGQFGATANPAPNVFGAPVLQDASRTIFALNSAAQDTAQVFLNLAGIENIDIDADAGADDIVINNQVDATNANGSAIQIGSDLAATSLRAIDIDLGFADGGTDNVEVHGQQTADDVTVSVQAGVIDVAGFDYEIQVTASETLIDDLFVHGQAGDDTIVAEAGVEASIGVTFAGDGGADFLSADGLLFGGPDNDTLIGGAGDNTLDGGLGDDLLDGRGGFNIVTGGDGSDAVLVSGTAADEILDVVHTAGVVTITGGLSAGTQNIAEIERVWVQAGEGSDTINLTTLAGGLLDYEVLGGNPIGSIGDTLNITSPSGVTFMEGPESDSGGFVDGDGAIISYDEVELVSMIAVPAGPLVIMGTGADDDITAVGVGADDVQVTVNDGPTITYNGVTSLTLQGKDGDDDITIDVNGAVDVEFIVDGGLPTAGSDELRVTGMVGLDDAPVWTPTSVDGGTLALASLVLPIDVSLIEHLFYDGESDQENLSVVAAGAGDNFYFTHTPGSTVDEGFVGVRNNIGERLGINYENLGTQGTVLVDGTGVADSELIAFLTDGDDEANVTFTGTNATDIDLQSALGTHLDLQSDGVNDYQIASLEGDDLINVFAMVDISGDFEVSGGGNGGGSDVLNVTSTNAVTEAAVVFPDNDVPTDQDITGLGAPIDVTGFEHINFTGQLADNDQLLVRLGAGDNTATVTRGSDLGGDNADLITSDSLPPIQFTGQDTFTIDGQGGANEVTVQTWSLAGATNTNYRVAGGGLDTLIIEGNDARDDDYDVTSPAADQVSITDNFGTNVTVTTFPAALPGAIVINTLGGDDLVELDALDLTAGATSITIDGGAGDDDIDAGSLGAKPGVTDDDVSLTLFGGDGNDNLIGSDPADGAAVSDVLYGGDGDDRLEGGRGRDQFFGGAGNDYFVWVAGDGSDLMEGGTGDADQLVFIANDGDTLLQVYGGGQFTDSLGGFFPGQTLSNSSRGIFELNAGQVFLNMGDVESIQIDALGGSDNIVINNQADANSAAGNPISQGTDLGASTVESIEVFAGAGDDDIEVHGTAGDDNLDAALQGGQITISGLPVALQIDAPEIADTLYMHGQEGNDNIKAAAGLETSIGIVLAGDAGDDFLSADAILLGGPGDDFLEGGAGNDQLFGEEGEDILIGGGGLDTIDGGDDYDQILIRGTSANDAISVTQSAAGTLDFSINGIADTDTIVTVAGVPTVESVRVESGDGADTIAATWSDALGVDADVNSLRIEIDGGDDFAADRLGVLDDGTGDLVIQHVGAVDTQGGIQIGPGIAEPLTLTYENVEIVQPVAAADGRIEVFKHDPYEFNDARVVATHLGAAQTINVDPTIDPGLDPIFGLPADVDYFRLEAEVTGTLDIQAFYEQIATVASGRPGLPGSGDLSLQLFDADGDLIAGAGNFGTLDTDDNGRIRVPVVQQQVYFLQVSGASSNAINAYDLTIVNAAPPTPFDLELDDAVIDGVGDEGSDTGRNNTDNITLDDTPTLFFRLDDSIFLNDVVNPVDGEAIVIPFQNVADAAGYRVAVFDEGQTPGTGAGTQEPQVPLGFATQVAGVPGLYTFTTPVLSDGSHFLTARVQMVDPSNPVAADYGPRSDSLEIIVDTEQPPASFGLPAIANDGLAADSDSGVIPNPHTFDDLYTNDTTPTFWGQAEANTIIRVYVDLNDDGVLDANDALIGQTTAIPLDGNVQEPDGYWTVESVINMNDDDLFPIPDGLRTIFVTAEDVAGNVNPPAGAADTLRIFIDTVGPTVQDVYITTEPTHNLFGIKNVDGTTEPTPRIDSLSIDFEDLPNRVAPDFLFDALKDDIAQNPGHYLLRGDQTGIVAIDTVTLDLDAPADGAPATATVTLTFFEPLLDDRFTLTISDDLVDLAGNSLDGESNATEPNGGLPEILLPTGDGVPGGDFLARFTVDSRPEVGTYSQSLVYVDINGNGVWDPEGQDNDVTNRDFTYQFGRISDGLFAGDFHQGPGASSGFDKLGAYGFFNGNYSFLIDTDDDGVGNVASVMPPQYQVNGIPVAGDFDGDPTNGDEIGLFDGSNWYFDTDGSNAIEFGEILPANYNGIPIVGEFDGDNDHFDLAVWQNETNTFSFDLDADGNIDDVWDVSDDTNRLVGLSGFVDRPVTGDLNLDGIDELGIWIKGRQGQLPKDSGEYFFWVSDDTTALPSNNFNSFSHEGLPGGNDLFIQFGDDTALPIVGNFDPIVASGIPDETGTLTNEANVYDVNNDGDVSALDALLVINAINRGIGDLDLSSSTRVQATFGTDSFYDVDGNATVSAIDALRVINELNRAQLTTPSTEPVAWADAVDSVFEDDDDDRIDEAIGLMF